MNRAKSYPRRWGYEVLATRPPTARRRSLSWGRMGIVTLLLSSLAILGHLFWDDGFYVYSPQVQGNIVTSPEAIISASGLRGLNIFFVDPQEASERIIALPDSASAKVRIALPNQVIIEITERQPNILWVVGEEMYPIDVAGFVLSPQPVEAKITIRSLEGESLKPGQQVDAEILQAAEAYQALYPALNQFDYSSQTGLSFLSSSGTRIILGTAERAQQKLALLQALQEHLRSRGVSATVIDLRFDPPYFLSNGE